MPMTIALSTTMTGPFDASTSSLRVYVDDGPTPVTTVSFERSCAGDATCDYHAVIPASATVAVETGHALVWHALLFDQAGHTLHTVGRVPK
jgi:hypothetical protein